MKQWLVYLYPRAWRQRYGDEFRAVLAQQRLTTADVVDVVRGALDAHWTQLLALPHDVVMKRVRAPLLLLVVLLVLYLFPSLLVPPFGGAGPWRFVARPPLPAHAQHMQIEYLRGPFYGDDSSRITTFDTDHPVTAIQQFYRTALPRRGWHYLCTVAPTAPSCGYSALRPEAEEVMDVYEPGLPVLAPYPVEITILRPDARGLRTVQILEVLVDRSNRLPRSTDPTGPPPVALVGQWRATDSAPGDAFILRVYQNNEVEIAGTGTRGTYQWNSDTTIRITFTSSLLLTRVVGEVDDGAIGLCWHAPAFFKDQCHVSVYDPAAYPVPRTPDPPTTPPTEAVSSRIDATFAVVVDGDTLTLTNASGTTQIFQRVDGT